MKISLSSRIAPMRSSSLATCLSCEREFFFKYRLGLTRKGSYSSALHTGSLLHTMVTSWFKGEDLDDCRQLAHTEHARRMSFLVEVAGQHNGMLWGKPAEVTFKQCNKDLATAEVMFDVFIEKYSREAFGLRRQEYEPLYDLIEKPLETMLPGRVVPIRGRMDLPLVHHPSKTLWIWDLKTLKASDSPRSRAAGLLLEYAPHLYRELLEAHKPPEYKGYPVAGVILFVMNKPSKQLKQRQTLTEYRDEIREWYEEQELKHEENPQECARPVYAGPELFPKKRPGWVDTALDQFELKCRQPLESDNFIPNYQSCRKWNRLCPYWDLCSSDPVTWASTIESTFDQIYREDEENNDVDG